MIRFEDIKNCETWSKSISEICDCYRVAFIQDNFYLLICEQLYMPPIKGVIEKLIKSDWGIESYMGCLLHLSIEKLKK